MRDFWYSFTVVFIAGAIIFSAVYLAQTLKLPVKPTPIVAVVLPVEDCLPPKNVVCKLCGFKTRYVVEYCPHCGGRQNGEKGDTK